MMNNFNLSQTLVEELIRKNITVSIAESCTGGLLSKYITDVAGASKCFSGSIVAYSNEAKENILYVNPLTIDKYGAVSGEVAREMALGAEKILKSRLTVSVTGISGPTGGTTEKPVGLVYSHIIFNKKEIPLRFLFKGSRTYIRERTASQIIQELLFAINERGYDILKSAFPETRHEKTTKSI